MTVVQKLLFEGDPGRRPTDAHPHSPQQPEPYVVSPELKVAVNLAIYLRRPLLLEGDAGCGKTRLASAIAYELGLPLYRWDVRSTTKAQEGLYEYDAILRLHDVQTQKVVSELSPQSLPDNDEGLEIPHYRDPSNPTHYRLFGPLGKAFKMRDRPAVVLIDEIDKADLDFPNDLLAVLDEPWRFTIKETGETIAANPEHKPIVIITSNKEKGNLPAPFLRRCLYHYVEFPNDPNRLKEIVQQHYAVTREDPPPDPLTHAAVEEFLTVWNEGGLFKKPGTSEFLDWLKALHTFGAEPYPAKVLQQSPVLPYRELLFKLQQDWKKYARAS
ncbi:MULTISPECIES: MoxR family ATPase [unclassified Leptolyngbya]|uniref:AAA family ATPase n=1 Tax=unclassified Leptolyngbya TaxID=2650499 RepID=UPI00168281C6|nr:MULTISPECIES: MoxR family ATPase [unclassified Leptolyngbya]MBD1913877.1 MoxR family ATPase [Leptolyngbya sp. FACHB-8]MBD2157387.1 MoxR family ATPase [Leptolyngbya sp. FACHB-16]